MKAVHMRLEQQGWQTIGAKTSGSYGLHCTTSITLYFCLDGAERAEHAT
jgi:hypothetical protein